MKLGTMQGVMNTADDAEVFERARRLGLHGIEVVLTLEEMGDANHPRIDALRALSEQTGLAVPSICLGPLNKHGFLAMPQRTEQVIGEIEVAIEWAVKLGAKVVLLPFFFANDPRGDEAKLMRTTQLLAPLCAKAAERGITLCYEGTLEAADLLEMATRIDSPAGFGVYFDLANVVWVGQDGPEQIRQQGPLIRQVHMKETKVGPGDVRPGQGRVDYAASAMALREIGYDGWLVLETPPGEEADVAADIAFTKRFFEIE